MGAKKNRLKQRRVEIDFTTNGCHNMFVVQMWSIGQHRLYREVMWAGRWREKSIFCYHNCMTQNCVMLPKSWRFWQNCLCSPNLFTDGNTFYTGPQRGDITDQLSRCGTNFLFITIFTILPKKVNSRMCVLCVQI